MPNPHAQPQTALGEFQQHEIAQALPDEAEKTNAAEAQRISTDPLPVLAEQWAELKAYPVDESGEPVDSGRALMFAYQGLKMDDQPKFRRPHKPCCGLIQRCLGAKQRA